MGSVSENQFIEQAEAPNAAAIEAALGSGYTRYEAIMEAAAGFMADWKFYGKKYGWKLKVHDGDKALLELSVMDTELRVSIAAREAEVEALRAGTVGTIGTVGTAGADGLSFAALLADGKAKEGWGIRIAVVDEASCARACALIKAVAAMRLKG
jgi:hypothetical protein